MRVRSVTFGVCLAVLGLAGAGCSGEFAGPDSGDAGLDTEGPGSTSGDPQNDPDSTTGQATTGADESTGEGGDSGTPEGACDVDCGPGGFCDFDDAGAPVCQCDDGYAAYGLRCLPCTPSNGALSIEIPKVDVTAEFFLNGEAFLPYFSNHGVIVLRDPATGDEVRLGDTVDVGTDDPVAILPGSYEVHYSHIVGSEVPNNRSALLDTVMIPDTTSHSLVVDVPAVRLSGLITMNEAPPPDGNSENGDIVLVNATTGDEVDLGETRDGEYAAFLVPGDYEIHYRKRAAQYEAPINNDAAFDTIAVYGTGEGMSQVVDIDVPVAILEGDFSLDGAEPPPGLSENGQIILRDTATQDQLVLGETRDGSYAIPVIPGFYDVVYRRLAGGDLVPVNSSAVLGEATLDAGPQTLHVDVPTAVIDGSMTIAGAPAPADPTNDGVLVLRSPDTSDEAVLGNTANGTYARRVVQGTYDLFYRQETSNGLVPVNTNARLGEVIVNGPTTHDIDVPMTTVDALVTVDGEIPPDSAYDDGLLYLRSPDTGDSVLLGNTRLVTLQRPVIPGTYDLHYVVEAAGPVMPINAESRLDTVEIGGATQLDVDIPVVRFDGEVTVAGEMPPGGFSNRADLLMQDVATRDVLYLGSIETGQVGQTVTAGTYILAYHSLSLSGAVPANKNAGLLCVELTP